MHRGASSTEDTTTTHRNGVIQRPSSKPHTPGWSLSTVAGSGPPLPAATLASHTVVGQAAHGGRVPSGSSQQMNDCTTWSH